ncbi:MAG: NADH-quinone oxidoreductase subunit NuoI [Chitinophagales bacterium]|nr:NADH-quinone oxidoreductase subunit NuoI [Chitinophagales bacterium]MDW8428219.1 NADH-quinone oxidoreductase subunit NuoI [Chitinophagales bacterium]
MEGQGYLLTGRAKVLDRPRLSWAEKMYLPAIVGGLSVTIKHLFRRKATVQFPEQKRPVPISYRGLHVLKRDENGAERCTACGLCAVACPAEAITMEAGERKPGEEHLYREEKYAIKYEINMLRCIFCGLCEEACPKEAIFLEPTFAPAGFDRNDFIYGKDRLLEGSKREEIIPPLTS